LPEELGLILAFAAAAGLVQLSVPLAIQLARATGFLDRPVGYKKHGRPTPYLGGLGVVAAVLPVALVAGGDLEVVVIAACAAGLCVVGIVGMIVGSVSDDNGLALTFGLVTAAAAMCLIVATAVTTATPAPASGPATVGAFDEVQAARVEELIQRLVARGVPEDEVRDLVREAVRLGTDRPFGREIPHIGRQNADD